MPADTTTYNNFLEAFDSPEAKRLDININTFTPIVWPMVHQILEHPNLDEELNTWSASHREAFLSAYRQHYPFDSGRKMFTLLTPQESFIATILLTLHH